MAAKILIGFSLYIGVSGENHWLDTHKEGMHFQKQYILRPDTY